MTVSPDELLKMAGVRSPPETNEIRISAPTQCFHKPPHKIFVGSPVVNDFKSEISLDLSPAHLSFGYVIVGLVQLAKTQFPIKTNCPRITV